MFDKLSWWRGPSVVWVAAAAVLFLFPSEARADAGIPMLPVAYPVVLLFLLPVIAIEAIYLRSKLQTEWWNTLKATAGANAVTLVLGYPLAWALMLGIEFGLGAISEHIHSARLSDAIGYLGLLSPAWIGPTEDRWPVLIAFVILLIPSFLLSGFVEARLLDHHEWLRHAGSSSIAVWWANLLSYAFLAGAGCLALWIEMVTGKSMTMYWLF